MAKAIPLPKYITDLMKVYTDSKQRLIDTVSKGTARGNAIGYQQKLIRQIDAEIAKLNKFSIDWANDTLPKEYRKGAEAAIKGIRDLGSSIPEFAEFSKLHTRAIEAIIQNASDDLINANNFVGRSVKDIIRTETNQAIAQKLSTGETVKQAQKGIQNALVDAGYKFVPTKSGRRLNLESYAETVARSTTREATNIGTLNQLTSSGKDLVKMSNHSSSCGVCAPLEGRVYSISGTSKDYPPLSKAYSGVHANIHPNCRHVIMPYIPMLADDPEGDKEFSNRPFDTDPRSQTEIDNYNNQQKEKSELNRDKRQWERYKTVMPDNTPKTLSGFRKMKQANSEKFQQLQSDYKSVRQDR
jgi:hypothetical protein